MLNTAQTSKTAQYYNNERPSILNLVDTGPHKVLDLGCGAGIVGGKLKELGKAAELFGVEMFPSAAEEASKHYVKVYTGDLEQMDLPYGQDFDYVICGDILEHLKDPYTALKRIHGWLKDDGQLIVSLPNIRHWKVIADLLFRGTWEYQDAGIMDRTHLRFFTRRSCFAMLEEAGFQVRHWSMLVSGRKFKLMNKLSLGLLQEFLGSQIVVKSSRMNRESQPSKPLDTI